MFTFVVLYTIGDETTPFETAYLTIDKAREAVGEYLKDIYEEAGEGFPKLQWERKDVDSIQFVDTNIEATYAIYKLDLDLKQ